MGRELFEKRKKTIYNFISDERYIPMKIKEIAVVLGIRGEDREELALVLNELVAEGRIILSKRGKYKITEEKVLTGVFRANPKGYGFVTIEEMQEDIYIPAEEVHQAMHMDHVQVRLLKGGHGEYGKKKEGSIEKVLSHGKCGIVCTYTEHKNYGFAVPDNPCFGKDFFIAKENSKGAVTGHKVVVEVLDFAGKNRNPEGKVVEILGHQNDPGIDILSIVRDYGIPEQFPEKVLHQAERVSNEVSEADRAGRLDLRNLTMVTIDGEDAKDLDDAVSLSIENGNYVLGVHIADVANYVQERSALDVEAQNRGTSVYLTDRVIPMLPHKLSNGICSLNQGEDRLALSCTMTIDSAGTVIDHTLAETVIHVRKRMSYTVVNQILERKDEAAIQENEELVPMFEGMAKLAAVLRKKRMGRGSIDFDFPETKILLDEKGVPVDIRPYDRNTATKLIEEFMLIANETVAQDFYWQEIPFLYRTHDRPDKEKIRSLNAFINNMGYHIRISQEEVHPKELQKLLMRVDGSAEESLISRLTLRSMKRAAYTTVNTGHFGLAATHYCHFTSPIRRYPDLQIHRIIKETLRGRMSSERITHYEAILPEVAKHSSVTERRADDAERETVKMKKAEYMEKHIGEEFEGVISGVTAYGFFVELPNTIEGLVHVTKLWDDYYEFFENTYELVGEMTNQRYKLGQRIKIRVTSADKEQRTVDFSIPVQKGY